MLTTLICDNCGNKMSLVTAPIEIKIGKDRSVTSEAVSLFKCDTCGAEDIPAKESLRANNSAAISLVASALQGKQTFDGEVLRWLRLIVDISAKELSAELGLKPPMVSQWENRKTTFDIPTSQGIALTFAKLIVAAGLVKGSVFIEAVRSTVEKVA